MGTTVRSVSLKQVRAVPCRAVPRGGSKQTCHFRKKKSICEALEH